MPDPSVQRVLDAVPVESLDDYRSAGGGTALAMALELDPGELIKVVEGASIAAIAVGADTVVIATKQSFGPVVERLQRALAELQAHHDHPPTPAVELVQGSDSYLFGEETALLEVVQGNPPFPRLSPPWRHGLDDTPGSSNTTMASPGPGGTAAAPVLVNNAETLAHVTDIVGERPGWFNAVGMGDERGTGTFLCTVTGAIDRHGVLELPVGSSLNDALAAAGASIVGSPLAVMAGVSHPLISPEQFDDPLGYGPATLPVGSGAFRFFNTETIPVAIAAGAARFLAVESCGQCEPCKADGLALSEELDDLVGRRHHGPVLDRLTSRIATITDGARCALARQHQDILADLLTCYPAELDAYLQGHEAATDPVFIAPIRDLTGAVAELDQRQRDKLPDWSYGTSWSGSYPGG